MQGYILNIVRVKDEDLIVSLLSKNSLQTLYRFYGARHSTINLGFHIDFVVQHSQKSSIPMLREVLHLGEFWQNNHEVFYIWQSFIKLLHRHLKDVVEVDEFYYHLLYSSSNKIQKQNPKRVLIESYLKLLEHEGRLHLEFECIICEKSIKENLVLKRGYISAHYDCLFGYTFDKKLIQNLFITKSTLLLDNDQVDILWDILCEGL
jgi:recombinational DNA repair protein (RecF pathway)